MPARSTCVDRAEDPRLAHLRLRVDGSAGGVRLGHSGRAAAAAAAAATAAALLGDGLHRAARARTDRGIGSHLFPQVNTAKDLAVPAQLRLGLLRGGRV